MTSGRKSEGRTDAGRGTQTGHRCSSGSSGNGEAPVLANLTMVHPSSGMAFIDFGFLDPVALAGAARQGRSGKTPERLNGRLAVRVAVLCERPAAWRWRHR